MSSVYDNNDYNHTLSLQSLSVYNEEICHYPEEEALSHSYKLL